MEKGFARTLLVRELVDPKVQAKAVKECDAGGAETSTARTVRTFASKGNLVKIPEPPAGHFYGDVDESGDGYRCSGRSSLFFLTFVTTPESRHAEKVWEHWHSGSPSEPSGAHRLSLENPL